MFNKCLRHTVKGCKTRMIQEWALYESAVRLAAAQKAISKIWPQGVLFSHVLMSKIHTVHDMSTLSFLLFLSSAKLSTYLMSILFTRSFVSNPPFGHSKWTKRKWNCNYIINGYITSSSGLRLDNGSKRSHHRQAQNIKIRTQKWCRHSRISWPLAHFLKISTSKTDGWTSVKL